MRLVCRLIATVSTSVSARRLITCLPMKPLAPVTAIFNCLPVNDTERGYCGHQGATPFSYVGELVCEFIHEVPG